MSAREARNLCGLKTKRDDAEKAYCNALRSIRNETAITVVKHMPMKAKIYIPQLNPAPYIRVIQHVTTPVTMHIRNR
jgi:hypothetical protein